MINDNSEFENHSRSFWTCVNAVTRGSMVPLLVTMIHVYIHHSDTIMERLSKKQSKAQQSIFLPLDNQQRRF